MIPSYLIAILFVDAVILLVAGALILTGLWLLFHSTAEAWQEWKR